MITFSRPVSGVTLQGLINLSITLKKLISAALSELKRGIHMYSLALSYEYKSC
jgi:hypothetical protein